MNNRIFKKELEGIISCATEYISDYFYMPDQADNPKMKGDMRVEFERKRYEGFRQAQHGIARNISLLEEELKECRDGLSGHEKGGEKKMQGECDCAVLEKKLDELIIQKFLFQQMAHAIVWNLYVVQQKNMKSVGNDMEDDSFILMEGGSADNMQRMENGTDNLSFFYHVGDLIISGADKTEIVKIGQKSSASNIMRIQNILGECPDGRGIDPSRKENRYSEAGGYADAMENIKLFCRQMLKTNSAIECMKGKECRLKSGQRKKTANLCVPDSSNMPDLIKFVDNFYISGKIKDFIKIDCLMIGIFKNDQAARKDISKMTEFKEYVRDEFEGDDKDDGGKNSECDIYDLRTLVRVPSHIPLFLLLPDRYIVDLITKKITVYVYFDAERLLKKSEEAEVPIMLCGGKEIDEMLQDVGYDHAAYDFNGRYMCIGSAETGKIKAVIGCGLLFKLMFEFQSSDSFLCQIEELASQFDIYG